MPNGLKIFEERVTGGERDRGMDREIDRDRGGGKRKRENHSFDIHKYVFCMLSLSTIYSMKMGFHENHIEIQSHSISSIHCFDNVYIFFFFSLSPSFVLFPICRHFFFLQPLQFWTRLNCICIAQTKLIILVWQRLEIQYNTYVARKKSETRSK